MARPNILLITTDEHNPRALGYAGDPVIRTPSIDRLAREGMAFHRAYTTQPLCTPARASMWTGRHVTTHGVRGNMYTGLKGGVRAGTLTFSRLLQRHGYETALIGKRHLAFEHEADIGLDHQDLAESKFNFNPPGVVDDYRRWLAAQGRTTEEITTWEREDLAEQYRKHYGAIRFPLDEQFYIDAYIGRRAVDYLRRERQRPFFLWVSFCSPHHPWDPPARYDEMYDPADVVLPERRPRELHYKPRRQLEKLQFLGPGLPDTTRDETLYVAPDQAYDKIPEAVQRKMIARYYGTITLVDDRIGDMLAALEQTGLAANTVVIFTSDHGDHLGEHHLWFKGGTMYECLVRVPLVLRLPGGEAGRDCRELISLFDLAPTFLEWAGVPDPGTFDGVSIAPLVDRPDEAIHDELFIGRQAVVTKEWKFVWNQGDLPELYHLAQDPKELVNLSGDPDYAEVEGRLRERVFERFGLKARSQ